MTNDLAILISRLFDPNTPIEELRRVTSLLASCEEPEALHALRVFSDSEDAKKIKDLKYAVEECYFWNLVAAERNR